MTRCERGFTLLELLVVMGILSILSTIALTSFYVYKENSYNATAKSDFRNGITGQEAAFVDNDIYATCTDASDCESELPGFVASKDDTGTAVTSTFEFTGTVSSFTGSARHTNGTITFTIDSTEGSIQES